MKTKKQILSMASRNVSWRYGTIMSMPPAHSNDSLRLILPSRSRRVVTRPLSTRRQISRSCSSPNV